MLVYLHIGAHKTGTTAIQMALAASRKRLGRNGVVYPVAGRPVRPEHSYGHHSLAWCLTRPEGHPDCWPQLRAELDSSRGETAVISSECLDLITEEEHFDHMRSHLAGHDVRVLVYLRRQDEFLHAHYCTNVLFYGETREFEDFLRDPPTEPDYRALLARWERAFGREALIVRPYERSQLIDGDIMRDFATRAGISLPRGFMGPASDRVNRSYPRNVIESARRLGLAGTKPKDMGGLRELCVRVYGQRSSEADMLPPGERLSLMETYAESNAFVARTYIGREDGRLFEDLSVSTETPWERRYAGSLAELHTSIRDVRDAFRERAGQGTA